MSRTTGWFAAVVGLQIAFLLAWAGWHEQIRQTAPVIRLKTVPVDPRDLLRGDFMILRYEISSVEPPVADRTERAPSADFWVLLEERDGYHTAVRASWEKPVPGAGQLAVRGRRGRRGGVDYGIETYFVPEGKGTPRARSLEVEASVGPTHRLQIKRVFVDGKPYP